LEEFEQNKEEVVRDAMKKSKIESLLYQSEHGMNANITKEFDDDGVVISGGQAQSIAIARLYAKNHSIAILDEPSSNLDPIAESRLYEEMLKVTKGKSVIYISHRLSCAKYADRIYFFEKGEIVEVGSHQELMHKDGKYAEMFRLQASAYNKLNTESPINKN